MHGFSHSLGGEDVLDMPYPLVSLVDGPAQEGADVLVRMSEFEYHSSGLKGQLGIGYNPAMEGHPLVDAASPCGVGLIRVEVGYRPNLERSQ